jgi:hypothetical protein
MATFNKTPARIAEDLRFANQKERRAREMKEKANPMDAIYTRIYPSLSQYPVHHIRDVLEEVLEDDKQGLLTDSEIIELVADILENDPPLD